MVTGMILSSDNFSNVTIDNGKVISDGDKEMVVGVAVPGLKDSLDLSGDLSDKIDIPEGFTMEADVTDCYGKYFHYGGYRLAQQSES